MKKFKVCYVNDVTGEMWNEIVIGEGINEVRKACEAMLERDVLIDDVCAIEKIF